MKFNSFTIRTASLCAATLLGIGLSAQADNPVIPFPFTADPSIRQWSDGKFYIYGSHDKDIPGVWDMDDYHVFSSDDLVNWKDNGVALRNSQTPWGGPFWAPDAAEKDGRFYFYFPEGGQIGVAESASPVGPFENPRILYKMPAGYAQAYDPAIFQYKGSHYMIISERASLTTSFYPAIFKLKPNMTEIEPGSKVSLPPLNGFHEGPFIFERENKWYMIGGGYASLRYWMADSPFGPWDYKGDFFKGNDTFTISKTAHGSAIEAYGQWYLTYHYDVYPGGPYRRTTCIDYMHFNEDGTIQPITPTRKGAQLRVMTTDNDVFASSGELKTALLAGPFPAASPEAAFADDIAPDTRPSSGEVIEGVAWKSASVGGSDIFNFKSQKWQGQLDNAAAYLSFWVQSPRAADDKLRFDLMAGADDAAKIWLNGKSVYAKKRVGAYKMGDIQVNKLPMKAGWNHFLVKVVQGTGDWKFGARLKCSDPVFARTLKASVEKPQG